jgi:glyoxylase-like metal-dependent hydrolase (beta-lactamase superfamily II)
LFADDGNFVTVSRRFRATVPEKTGPVVKPSAMNKQIPLDPAARALSPDNDEAAQEIASDLAYRRLAIVNVVFFGRRGAGDRGWVLIDAGLPATEHLIVNAARERFGEDARPAAIIQTHGHFDHVGVLKDLAERWDVPIYAHALELPFLDGRRSYPPADPSVGGGMMARLSPLFPRGPVDVSPWLKILPEDHSVPFMTGWRWLHTPGHAPGHISLWRESDRTLIAGDAFVTTRQESVYAALTQEPEMHGPPQYYTPDWEAAAESVRALAALEPELVITGHGAAMRGPVMRDALRTLAREFERIAVPEHGRYVNHPTS